MNRIILMALFWVLIVNANAEVTSPYSGQQSRDIKALSPDKVAGLLGGKGLGYAKVAELNGFPGPAHVLELATELELSADQKIKTQAIFDAMQTDAKRLGEALVRAERELDGLFVNGAVTEGVVLSRLEEIGTLEGQLRAVHVNAHIKQRAILSKHQIHRYNQLRGYSAGANTAGHSHEHH